MLIFYCGGLACRLSAQSAELAMQNGFTNVKVFYEGMPAWSKGGNYKIVELDYVKKKVMEGGKELDASGMYLMPGFIDMHGHIGEPPRVPPPDM